MTRSDSEGLKQRTLVMPHRRTTVRLEDLLWESFLEICAMLCLSKGEVGKRIDECYDRSVSFTSALRVFIFAFYRYLWKSPNAHSPLAISSSLDAALAEVAIAHVKNKAARPDLVLSAPGPDDPGLVREVPSAPDAARVPIPRRTRREWRAR